LKVILPETVTAIVEKTFLNPANPLKQDSNLRHVDKMLNQLSKPAARLWSRLQAGEQVMRTEAVGDLYLELYLTGAVKSEAERLIIRNRVYERAFAISSRNKAIIAPRPKETIMSQSFRVFISSTWIDLQPERAAVEKALHRMQSTTFAGMEYFGSRPETPKEVSLAEVSGSDVYIVIFAHRYGSGITEAEYRRARELDIPCLIYIKDDNTPVIPAYMEREPEKASKLEGLKRELKQNHTLTFFNTPDNLATGVITDLHNLLNSMPGIEKIDSSAGKKYHINITGGQGFVIGDQAQVTQHFEGTESSPKSVIKDLRLDAAAPEKVYLDRAFELAVAIRRPTSPILNEEELENVRSGNVQVHWPESEPYIRIRVKINAPECEVHDSDSRSFLLLSNRDSPVFFFHLTPRKLGDISIIIQAYHQDDGLGSTRVNTTVLEEIVGAVEMKITSSLLQQEEKNTNEVRLQHLSDNIQQDMALLKEYEDALRYEDDPRRRVRYRREIERLRQSAATYRAEIAALKDGGLPKTQQDSVQNVSEQLQQMDVKLDAILKGQTYTQQQVNSLREAVLSRLDESEQSILANVVAHLDESQLVATAEILNALEDNRVADEVWQELLTAVQKTLAELQQQPVSQLDSQTTHDLQQVAEIVAEPRFDVRHKLKVAAPIIPFILSYEGEIELNSSLNLEAAWQQFVARFRSDRT
jgi:hypothetical protein